MEKIKSLLKDFLDGKLKPMDFVDQYLAYARFIRDEQTSFLAGHPLISLALQKLALRYYKHNMPEDEYFEKVDHLLSTFELRVPPYSRQEVIISHLFVEADAYRDPDDYPDPPLTIDEKTLRDEVQKGLDELNEIERRALLSDKTPPKEATSEEKTFLYRDENHRYQTHTRWLNGQVSLNRNRDGKNPEFHKNSLDWVNEQCSMCQFYIPLKGELGRDWGACTNTDSIKDGKLTYYYDGCEHFSLAEDEEEL